MKISTDNIRTYNRQSRNNISRMSFSSRNFKGNIDDLEAMTKKAKNVVKEISYTLDDTINNVSDKIEKKSSGVNEFFSNMNPFSKKNKLKKNEYVEPQRLPKQKPPIKEELPVMPPKPKFELPKPEFKYDETNPTGLAKEKEAYIKSIISHADKSEEIALLVMEKFSEYGSKELLNPLLTSVSLLENKTDKVANSYLKLYDKFTKDEADIEKILTAPLGAIIKEFEEVLSKESIALLISGFKRAGNHPGDLMDVRGFMIGDRYPHTCLRKFGTGDLDEIDRMAQEAEEVIRKRIYNE